MKINPYVSLPLMEISCAVLRRGVMVQSRPTGGPQRHRQGKSSLWHFVWGTGIKVWVALTGLELCLQLCALLWPTFVWFCFVYCKMVLFCCEHLKSLLYGILQWINFQNVNTESHVIV